MSASGNKVRDGMPGVAEIDDERLIAVFETNAHGGRFVVSSVTSDDDGVTWEVDGMCIRRLDLIRMLVILRYMKLGERWWSSSILMTTRMRV